MNALRSAALAGTLLLPSLAVAAEAPPRAPTPVVAGVEALRQLPVTSRPARLAGEIDELEWPVYLTEADASGPVALRLAYRSAVSVMPEASRLTVVVNGRTVETRKLEAAPNRRVVDFDLPSGVARAGWNAVKIVAEQRHRVDCSLASTYELWTEIDSRASGLMPLATTPVVGAIADLATAVPDAGGATRLRLVVSPAASADEIAVATRAAGVVALLGGFEHPLVEIAREPGTGAGLDVVLGGEGGRGQGVTLDRGTDGRPVLTLAGRTPAEWTASVDALAAGLTRRPGPAEGLAALDRLSGLRVDGETVLTFADAGVESREFSGRVFRATMDVTLPADFYAAAYDKVRVKLAGGYRSGLDPAARIVVRVNGEMGAGLPLADPAGELFRDRTITLPLTKFRPGLNRIEIDAQTPTATDRACDTLSQVDEPARFLFLDQTSVTFPRFARAVRVPDLAALSNGAFRLSKGEALPVFVPHPDAEAVGAAVTLVTRLSLAAGEPIDVRFVFRAPPADLAAGLVVGAHVDMPPALLGEAGLSGDDLRRAWVGRAGQTPVAAGGRDQLDRRVAALKVAQSARADDIVTGSVGTATAPVAAGHVPRRDLYEAWRTDMKSQSWLPDVSGFGFDGLARAVHPIVALVKPEPAAEAPKVVATTGVLIAQAPSSSVTLVTAASSRALVEGVGQAVDPAVWNRLSGRGAALDMTDLDLSTTGGHRGLPHVTDASLGNLRLVTAGYLSENPLLFALFAVFAALLLGATTTIALRRVGVRV